MENIIFWYTGYIVWAGIALALFTTISCGVVLGFFKAKVDINSMLTMRFLLEQGITEEFRKKILSDSFKIFGECKDLTPKQFLKICDENYKSRYL